MITLLLDPDLLACERVEIEGAEYRHLFRARRLAVGERLRAVDGAGQARWAEIEKVERRRASLILTEPAPNNEPDYRLHLLVAALRSERASWLVEKATELGVSSIRFVATRRTPRKYGEASLERWRRVAAAAVTQCHRSALPEISGVDAWDAWTSWLRDRPKDCDRYFLHPSSRAAESSEGWLARRPSGLVLIGPEGGWSDEEARQLEGLGFRPVSLGPRILRVETAAIVAASRMLLESRE